MNPQEPIGNRRTERQASHLALQELQLLVDHYNHSEERDMQFLFVHSFALSQHAYEAMQTETR